VREYKILKSSLKFIVDTEEAEGIRHGSVENATDKSHDVSSVGVNNHAVSNLEATLNDIDQLGLEPDPGSRILTETPLLDDSSMINLPFADIDHQSFFGSGASAESVKSEVIQQPFDVVDGTTLYYETDGKHADSDLHLPQVQPTVTTSDSPSKSVEVMGTDSVEKVTLETQPQEVKVTETVRQTELESDEKRTESIFVVDKIETESVTGKGKEFVVQHKREAQNIEHKSVDSIDKTEREAEVVEDLKQIIDEPMKEMGIKTEESEKYGEEEDEEDMYDDGDGDDDDDDDDDDEEEEDKDTEEEVSEEVAELPSTDVQKTVEEMKSMNITDASSQPSDVDTLKFKDEGTVHLSLETDTNVNDILVDNSKADGPNLQESTNDVLLQDELPENLTDLYETSKEVTTDKPSALAFSTLLPASESKNANQTGSNVGSAEELEHTQTGETHENAEGSGLNEEVDTHQESADTENLLSNDQNVEGKEVISGSGEIINSVDGNPEDISENLKKQNIHFYPELVSNKNTDYNSEISSEAEGEINSNLYEEHHTDSTQEATETTTTTSSEEQYYEVTLHESSTEETPTTASTFISEEPLLPVEGTKLMSEEEGIIKLGGLFSDLTNTLSAGIRALTSVFGGSSSDSHISEVISEVNETEQDVGTEGNTHTDKADDTNMKKEMGDTGWPSVFGDLNTEHVASGNHLNKEEEEKCKLNFSLFLLLHNVIKMFAKENKLYKQKFSKSPDDLQMGITSKRKTFVFSDHYHNLKIQTFCQKPEQLIRITILCCFSNHA
jgi:hypothetical protein